MVVTMALQQYVPPSIISICKYLGLPESVDVDNGPSLPKTISIALGIYCGWKSIRALSMSGNSDNYFIKQIQNVLKDYLNCGNMIWGEFYTRRQWQYLWMGKGRSVIVNYGSWGTVPRKVLQHQIDLQVELECFPDIYNRITLVEKYEASRRIVAKHVGADVQNLVFVDNIADGINCTLRCVLKDLDEDDIVLHTSLTFSGVLKAIAIYTKQYDIKTLQFDVNFPIVSEDALCDAYEAMIVDNPKIKVATFDHIACASAVCFPIERFGRICRKYNVMSIVDGAHAPGQLHLDLESYGVDIYLGGLHKWYYAPKSVTIMYINPKYHDKMHPSLVSHNCYLGLHERFRRQGTKNYSAHISAGFACEYMERIGGINHLHSHITPLVDWVVGMYSREWKCEEVAIPDSMKAPYMRVVHLPLIFTKVYGSTTDDAECMITDMIKNYNICMFVHPVAGRLSTRVSAQIFSTKREYVYAANVIKKLAKDLESQYELNNQLQL